MANLEGKVAVVTGASRGIGAAIAQRLAAEGAAVAVTARTLDAHERLPGSLNETVETITSAGGRAVAIAADLLETADRERIVTEAESTLGPIDILINNAAAGFFFPFEKFSAKRVGLALEINLRAPFELAQRVVPGMKERKSGCILNITTAAAEHPSGPPYPEFDRTAGPYVYGMSKAALNRFTTGLAAELYDHGIAVNALAPVAAVATPGVVALGQIPDDPEMLEPMELMAEAAYALCTSDPGVMTGRILYTRPFLAELGVVVRTLDGKSPYDGSACK